jgi:hypothetical protein
VGSGDGCCDSGLHGATRLIPATGSTGANGNQGVQTWIFASYLAADTFDPARRPFDRDISTLTHEVAEWADDPFIDNAVNPWSAPQTAPQYGCDYLLETGDPVHSIEFTLPGNTYDSGYHADGYWHPQDEVMLPWFTRQAPNTTSQPTQTPSAFGGRYTFLGDLNPYADFHQPASGC